MAKNDTDAQIIDARFGEKNNIPPRKPNGGAAYPFRVDIHGPAKDPFTGQMLKQGETGTHIFAGLSKREVFAMMAMSGCLTRGVTLEDDIAKMSVNLADALMAELAK